MTDPLSRIRASYDRVAEQAGDSIHLDEFLGQAVDLDGCFLSPDEVASGLHEAGFDIPARFERAPMPDIEYPSRRSYLVGRRRATAGEMTIKRVV